MKRVLRLLPSAFCLLPFAFAGCAASNGGGKAAIFRTFDVTTNDGTLNLNFTRVVDNAIVSGIQSAAAVG